MASLSQTQSPARRITWLELWDKLRRNYLLRRLARAVFIIWLVTTIIFFVIRLMPGNPIEILVQDMVVNRNMSEDEALRRAAGLFRIDFNEPLGSQYLRFMGNLLRGDLGNSFLSQNRTVAELIAQRLPWTLFSVGTSLFISFGLGILLGMVAAYKRNSWLDHLVTNLAAAFDAVPAYLIAILLVLLLGVIWKLVPLPQMRGAIDPGVKPGFTLEFIASALRHLLVPAMVYVSATVGNWILSMKSSTVGALGEDYVTVAKARGLPESRIITAYVGRNASLPLVTAFALSLGFAVGGSILIETIFVYPGIGLLLSQSLTGRDYPVMQGIFLMTTITVVVTNLLTDLLYGYLDPRIRGTAEES
jgi:peptide/nickel transport system permease protein